jgi:hypothetical protein
MNKASRRLAVTGMALIAGLTLGAGPAAASSSTPTPTSTQQAAPSADRVIRYYPSLRSCLRAGRIGVITRQWRTFDCDRVFWGLHRGWYALDVQRWGGWPGGGWPGDGPGGGHGWPGDDGPDWPGGGPHGPHHR